MTADITLADHPHGTDYRIIVRLVRFEAAGGLQRFAREQGGQVRGAACERVVTHFYRLSIRPAKGSFG